MTVVYAKNRKAWLDEVQRGIESIAALPAGWNGPGSQAPNREHLAVLSGLLIRLPLTSYWVPSIAGLKKRGEVQAEWRKGRLGFEIEVTNDGITVFAPGRNEPTLELENLGSVTDEQLAVFARYLDQA